MIFIWLIVGIAVVSAAFFFPGFSTDLWPNIDSAGVAAVLYLCALLVYVFRDVKERKPRFIAWGVFFVVAVFGITAWSNFRATTRWQHDLLLQIQQRITRGIIIDELPKPLLATLVAYHQQDSKKPRSIQATFQALFPNRSVGKNFREAMWEGDKLTSYVALMNDTSVVLIGCGGYSKGRDPKFKNFDGSTGIMQLRATLTKGGMAYEWQN